MFEKLYQKLAKFWLDKFLDELGKELGNENLKNNVYSFWDGMKLGMSLSEVKYEEKDIFLVAGAIFGYVFSNVVKDYLKEKEKRKFI
jgi:hypothetical protein